MAMLGHQKLVTDITRLLRTTKRLVGCLNRVHGSGVNIKGNRRMDSPSVDFVLADDYTATSEEDMPEMALKSITDSDPSI
jgi:hypothetical protein